VLLFAGRNGDAAVPLHYQVATATFRPVQEDSVKKIVLALVVAVASVGIASAQTTAKTPAKATSNQTKAAPAMKTPAAKAHSMKAEVVSTDAAAKTITVKDAAGTSTTLTATGGAVAALDKVKAGDWVMVTHTDTTATKIAKVKATGAKKPAKK
jgi:glucose/arabinose dehydrogenase